MNAKRILGSALVLVALVLPLSACSSGNGAGANTSAGNITIKDLPVHPKAADLSGAAWEPELPWPVDNSGETVRLTSGPYEGYGVEGPVTYSFWDDELAQTAMQNYYRDQLTKMGWTRGKSPNSYVTRFGISVVGQTWTKGNQVVFLAVYRSDPKMNGYELTMYLLTRQ
jgi:hypothetical protein